MFTLTLANSLAALLIVTSVVVVATTRLKTAALAYAVQSLVLVAIFVTLAQVTHSHQLFVWAGSALVTKVLLVPGILLYSLKKMGAVSTTYKNKRATALLIVAAVVEVALCFWVVGGIHLPGADQLRPALAVSLAHFFIGLTCIVSQRNIFKQILGFCLMENGSHLTLALLAPTAPELVEVGVATDAIFAVVIMSVIAYRIYATQHTLDAQDLMDLKG